MKRKRIIISLFLIFVLCLTSCGKGGKDKSVNPNFGGEINLFAYTPDSVNPLVTEFQTNAQVFSLCCESLFTLNNDLTVTNSLAESYSHSEDSKVWRFKLKKGCVFSDGTLLTAENVINSINMLRKSPKNMYYPLMTYVSGYKAISDYEFEITLKIPGNTFLTYMAFPIVKSREEVVGSGPYKIVSQEKDLIVMKATDSSKTNIETVNVLLYPRTDMHINAYISKETDVISADFYDLARLSASDRSTQTEYVSDYFTFLGFNTESETGGDINIRKAIASLIDKENMVESLFVGHATPTNTPFKPGTIYSNLNTADYSYSKEKAIAFLEKSEKELSDISFSILVNDETVGKLKTAEFIANKLCEAGMDVTVNKVGYNTYIQKIKSDDFVAFIGETKMPPDYDVSFLFSTTGNNFNFVKDELTESLHSFTYANTFEEKAEFGADIQKILINNVPLISLYYRTNTLLTDNKIKGDFNPLHNNIFNGFNKWTVK